jgi:hypothetical protein
LWPVQGWLVQVRLVQMWLVQVLPVPLSWARGRLEPLVQEPVLLVQEPVLLVRGSQVPGLPVPLAQEWPVQGQRGQEWQEPGPSLPVQPVREL